MIAVMVHHYKIVFSIELEHTYLRPGPWRYVVGEHGLIWSFSQILGTSPTGQTRLSNGSLHPRPEERFADPTYAAIWSLVCLVADLKTALSHAEISSLQTQYSLSCSGTFFLSSGQPSITIWCKAISAGSLLVSLLMRWSVSAVTWFGLTSISANSRRNTSASWMLVEVGSFKSGLL